MEVLHNCIVNEVFFPSGSVAALLNISSEIPELYRSDWRIVRL